MIASMSEGFHHFCKSARSARRQCEKRLNVCTAVFLLHIYSNSSSVRSPVCPVNKNKVLIPIKLLVVYIYVTGVKFWYEINVALITTDSTMSHDTQLHSNRFYYARSGQG